MRKKQLEKKIEGKYERTRKMKRKRKTVGYLKFVNKNLEN